MADCKILRRPREGAGRQAGRQAGCGCHSPGVLLAGAAPAVQRDDFVSADSCFAYRTLLPAGPRLQPLGQRWEEGGHKAGIRYVFFKSVIFHFILFFFVFLHNEI